MEQVVYYWLEARIGECFFETENRIPKTFAGCNRRWIIKNPIPPAADDVFFGLAAYTLMVYRILLPYLVIMS